MVYDFQLCSALSTVENRYSLKIRLSCEDLQMNSQRLINVRVAATTGRRLGLSLTRLMVVVVVSNERSIFRDRNRHLRHRPHGELASLIR